MRQCSGWINVVKIQMFLKIFAMFCAWVLTHNALQYLLFFFFFSLPIFVAKVFFASVQYVASWSAVIQDRTCFLRHSWKFPFAGSVNFCPKSVRPAKTYTNTQTHNARCLQLCREQLNKTAVWNWRVQSIGNMSFGLCKRFIMNLLWTLVACI